MNLDDAIRLVRQWGPFAMRTAGYGTVSLVAGPLTREHGASTWAMRQWCIKSAKALKIEIDAAGFENVPTDDSYVYASNHQSMIDIIVLGAVLPGDYKWAAKRELMKVPFLGWHLALSGHVPVDRGGGPKAAAKIVSQFEKVLHEGKPLLIFPEGTRNADRRLTEFKTGGFVAAVKANKPIVPVTIDGTGPLVHNGAVLPNAFVKVRIGRPIQPLTTGKESDRIRDLRDRTYASVRETLLSIGGIVAEAPAKKVRSTPKNDDGGSSEARA